MSNHKLALDIKARIEVLICSRKVKKQKGTNKLYKSSLQTRLAGKACCLLTY